MHSGKQPVKSIAWPPPSAAGRGDEARKSHVQVDGTTDHLAGMETRRMCSSFLPP